MIQSADERKPFVLAEEVEIARVIMFDEVEMERPEAPLVAKVKVGPVIPFTVVVAVGVAAAIVTVPVELLKKIFAPALRDVTPMLVMIGVPVAVLTERPLPADNDWTPVLVMVMEPGPFWILIAVPGVTLAIVYVEPFPIGICPFKGVVEVARPPEETPKGFVRVKEAMLEVVNVAWPSESNLVMPFN